MLIRQPSGISENEVTDRRLYIARRSLIAGVGAAAVGGYPGAADAAGYAPTDFAGGEAPTPLAKVSAYNNYYEFGTEKSDPAANAGTLNTKPWSVTIDGECGKPGTYGLEDILKGRALEDRIYRHRCVEAWSMVIPWRGFALSGLLKSVEPNASARFVSFETLFRPSEMAGQNSGIMPWPYREGLRIDEAMHPLTLLAVGMYGQDLPNQDGAPLRLVIPWKYGFKGIKAIVRITLRSDLPPTSWAQLAPKEYGFFANVNPAVDHPRWTQATERRIGDFFRRKTLPFNGYGEQVAAMYAGMDLGQSYS